MRSKEAAHPPIPHLLSLQPLLRHLPSHPPLCLLLYPSTHPSSTCPVTHSIHPVAVYLSIIHLPIPFPLSILQSFTHHRHPLTRLFSFLSTRPSCHPSSYPSTRPSSPPPNAPTTSLMACGSLRLGHPWRPHLSPQGLSVNSWPEWNSWKPHK